MMNTKVIIDHIGVEHFRSKQILVSPGEFWTSPQAYIEGPSSWQSGAHLIYAMTLGAFSYSWSLIRHTSKMGRYCSIAANVTFGEMEHPTGWLSTSSFTYDNGFIWRQYADSVGRPFAPRAMPMNETKRQPTEIGNDVWIGAHAYIRNGVTIGDGAIIGTRAVVTKDVPPYAVVAGNPGRVLKMRFDDNTIETLQALRWWQYDYTEFGDLDFTDVPRFVGELSERIAAGKIAPFEPVRVNVIDEINSLKQIPAT